MRFPFCALKSCEGSFGSGRWFKGILAGVLVPFVLRYSVCALSSLYCALFDQILPIFSIFRHQIGLAEQDFSHLGQRFCFWGLLIDISEEAGEHEPRQEAAQSLLDWFIDWFSACLVPFIALVMFSTWFFPSRSFSVTRTHAHTQVSLIRRHKWKVPFFWMEKKNKGGEDRGGLPQRPCFALQRATLDKCDRGSDAYSQTDRKQTAQYLQRLKGSHLNSGAVTTERLGLRVHEMWETPPLASQESRDILLWVSGELSSLPSPSLGVCASTCYYRILCSNR